MTDLWGLFAGIAVLGWILHHLPYSNARMGPAYAMAAFLILGTMAVGLAFGGLWVAVMEPFGAMLPVLCLASSARRAGVLDVPRIARWELLVLAALMLVVVLGAGAVLPLHLYAWFYTGSGPAVLALSVSGWALARGYYPVLVAVLLGQIMWLLDIGSSNLYDHLAHLMLIPAAVISAVWPRRS